MTIPSEPDDLDRLIAEYRSVLRDIIDNTNRTTEILRKSREERYKRARGKENS